MVGGKFKEARIAGISLICKWFKGEIDELCNQSEEGEDLLLGPFPSKTNIFLKYPKSFARKAVSLQDGYGLTGIKEQVRYHRQ